MKKLRFSIILILLIFSSLYISLPNAFSYTTGQSLAIVLGQIDFTSGSSNQGGSAAANTLSTPYSIATDGTRLAVADYNNNRVLLFNSIPTATNSSPDVVLGQSTFTGTSINAGGRSASSLNKPSGVAFAGNKLIVLDANNCRALVWNSFPTTNKQAADVVIGAPNFSTVDCDHTQTAFAGWKIYYDSVTGKLFIADYDYYRILIFNSVPTSNGAAADVVIGQTNFTSTTGGTSATKISGPTGIVVVNGKLLIVDRNHRVVIFNSIPTTNGAAADLVIGQQNLTGNSADQGGSAGANTLDQPDDITYDGQKLYIADTNNNRVLVYNSVPTVNNASADAVIGQPDFTTTSSGTSALKLKNPYSLTSAGQCERLIIADTNNNRIAIFNNNTPCLTPTAVPAPTSVPGNSETTIQIPQAPGEKNSGGTVMPIADSDTREQKVTSIIEPSTFDFNAFLYAQTADTLSLTNTLPKITQIVRESKSNVIFAGDDKPVLGIKNTSGTLWQVSHVEEVWYKTYPPNGSSLAPAKIIPELQRKPSIVALSYSDLDLVPSGNPRIKFNPLNLRLAYSKDGINWKILPSVVDAKNHTVASLHKIGGYYMIVGK